MLLRLQLLKTTSEIFIVNLRHRRERAGHTQTSFASEVGLSLRGYQKYEQGETQPTPEVLDRFAKELKCSAWELFVPVEKPDNSVRGDESGNSNRNWMRGGTSVKELQNQRSEKEHDRDSRKYPEHFVDDSHTLASAIAEEVITRLGSKGLKPEVQAVIRRFDVASPERQAAAMFCLTLDPHYLQEMVELTRDRGRAAKAAADALKALLSPSKK